MVLIVYILNNFLLFYYSLPFLLMIATASACFWWHSFHKVHNFPSNPNKQISSLHTLVNGFSLIH